LKRPIQTADTSRSIQWATAPPFSPSSSVRHCRQGPRCR
jgi:hypothetical protein